MLTGNEIRKSFLNYFEQQDHVVKPSSSLVPDNDPTLMFTNSGMVQFKNNFAGLDTSLSRAVTSQRCVRAGGKHNDLENVGHTARHHTFFEMLGNFSFGDYFKEEAITWAWQWITEDLNIDPTKLCVTIYHDDDEAFNIWNKKIGVADKDIIRIATSDNFWTMGDTGPCGPCSEIFFDHGPSVFGDRPGTPDEDGDRFMEIWNLVFTQFDLQPNGDRVPLPNKNIDTGAGLERLMAVAQGVHSNYDTDVFQTLIQKAASLTGTTYGNTDEESAALRVITDHLRCMTFLMVDGVMPSNEGRGYVLRRIMRRAMRYGHLLGVDKPFIHNIVPTLVNVMGEAYPELTRGASMAMDVIKLEEERFGRTLSNGLKVLEQESNGLQAGDTLPGEVAFKLYDTYGFPLDLTADALRARDIAIDEQGFQTHMEGQRAKARAAHKGTGDAALSDVWFEVQETHGATEFLGYKTLSAEGEAKALVQQGQQAPSLATGDTGQLVVNQTPFYAESGGQVGDIGIVTWEGGEAKVTDTQKVLDGVWQHTVEVTKGTLKVGTNLKLVVDEKIRTQVMRNHSVTHLLHQVLKEELGEHVFQKGSLVNAEKTRFDFSHPKALTADEIYTIEAKVNARIWAAAPVTARVMPKESAIELGAQALFGEKYGDDVRVLTMGEGEDTVYSLELCGGTHVSNTAEIGLFKLVADSSVAAGVRRVEAVTHLAAWQHLAAAEQALKDSARALNIKPEELATRVMDLQKELKKLKQEAKQASKKGAGGQNLADDLAKQAEQVAELTFIGAEVQDVTAADMRDLVDALKQKITSGIIVLATQAEGKSTLVAGVTKDLTSSHKAGDIVNAAAQTLGGKGGGRPDFAQAGGQAGDLTVAINAARAHLN